MPIKKMLNLDVREMVQFCQKSIEISDKYEFIKSLLFLFLLCTIHVCLTVLQDVVLSFAPTQIIPQPKKNDSYCNHCMTGVCDPNFLNKVPSGELDYDVKVNKNNSRITL